MEPGGNVSVHEGLHSFGPDGSRRRVLAYIEDTFSKILSEIQKRPYGHPQIVLRKITVTSVPRGDCVETKGRQVEDGEVIYGFPGKTSDEAWRFACLGKILFEIHEALTTGIVVSKRDIFYRDPELFRQQNTVDRFVDKIARSCQVTRRDLNTAGAKGLVAGISCANEITNATFELIPVDGETRKCPRVDQAKWILVIEKEASFKLLSESGIHLKTNAGRGVLITGKGYPDLGTRNFLRYLVDRTRLPVFGLFDGDPDGVNILKVYQFGSKTRGHERTGSVPEMKWLGLTLEELRHFSMWEKLTRELTSRDRRKARIMLSDEVEETANAEILPNNEIRRALQHMLLLNCKMEMQALEELKDGMAGWLEQELMRELLK